MTATPSRPRPRATKRGVAQAPGVQVDLTTAASPASPALPHERDQSVGATGGVPSKRMAQAASDLKRGVTDTSRGAEADTAYDKLKP